MVHGMEMEYRAKNKFFTRQFVSVRCLGTNCFMYKKQRRNGD